MKDAIEQTLILGFRSRLDLGVNMCVVRTHLNLIPTKSFISALSIARYTPPRKLWWSACRARAAALLRCSMLVGGFHRAPPAKPSCKLSRAVVDSEKDGAKQVRPKAHRPN